MPGIEPGPPRLSPRTVRPPYWWRITDQLRPIESEMVRKPGFAPGPSPSQGEMLLLHHDPDLKLEPRVGLAPTNTGLRNPPCSC